MTKKYILSAFFSIALSCSIFAKTSDIDALASRYSVQTPQNTDEYLEELLEKYHLKQHPVPFTYEHKTEFYSSLMYKAMELPQTFDRLSKHEFAYLSSTPFFTKSGVRKTDNKDLVRMIQFDKHKSTGQSAEIFTVTTQDGEKIEATWLKRNSDTVVIVGSGFTNYREQMAPLGDILDKYDVVFFDFRGHGVTESPINIDHNKVRLGLDEQLDTKAVVDYVRKKKSHAQVIGLGICFATLIFVKTESMYPKTFDKLILNGSWLSLHHATDVLSRDPGKVLRPQRESWMAKHWLFQNRWVRKTLLSVAQWFFDLEFNTVSVLDYMPKIRKELPILFIQGKNDALIPREQFEHIWNAAPVEQKAIFITSNPHVWDHWKEKEVYKQASELFIELPFLEFTEVVSEPQELIAYKAEKLHHLHAEQ